jgi:hypothetical protein
MGQRHSDYGRVEDDWYVEPRWTAEVIFDHAHFFPRRIHDPFCGRGTIVDAAIDLGFAATGSDIADRAQGRYDVVDFLEDDSIYHNIVSNPPFRGAACIVEKALVDNLAMNGKIALLVPANFLFSARRYPLFARSELAEILVLSQRPSMPPGSLLERFGETCRHSGSTDFCWAIWQCGREPGPARISWVPPQ